MTKQDALTQMIDATGHIIAHALNEMPLNARLQVAQQLDNGAASVVIRLHPVTATTIGTLETKTGPVELFRSGPLHV